MGKGAATGAVDPSALIAAQTAGFKPSTTGIVARTIVAILIAALIPVALLMSDVVWANRIAIALVFGIIGLSVNIITGHAGQISLGHQAFVGIGAFTSAYFVTQLGAGFGVAIAAAALTGALMSMALGLVALRISGLYLALITLAFGLFAEGTIFAWRAFTGGGAGSPAPRPTTFTSDKSYAFLCLIFLALFVYIDWRLVKSKAGRAIVAVRNDERVAATLGVNVTGYKLFAFTLGGLVAGTAGSLLAHRAQFAQSQDFELQVALVWILMAVVGGLGSRAGVVVGSMFFALFAELVPEIFHALPIGVQDFLARNGLDEVTIVVITPLLGALLLILTLTQFPGGIGQQLLPLRRWLAGGPFLAHKKQRRSEPKVGPQASPAEAGEPTADADETQVITPVGDETVEIPRADAKRATANAQKARAKKQASGRTKSSRKKTSTKKGGS